MAPNPVELKILSMMLFFVILTSLPNTLDDITFPLVPLDKKIRHNYYIYYSWVL